MDDFKKMMVCLYPIYLKLHVLERHLFVPVERLKLARRTTMHCVSIVQQEQKSTPLKRAIPSILGIFLFLLVPIKAYALLNIEITEALDKPRPIAVVPFNIGDGVNIDHAHELSDVISNDLRYSGQFQPLAELSVFPHSAPQVNYPDWQGTGVEAVLVGEIKTINRQSYQVNFALVDVVGSQKSPTKTLLQDSFLIPQEQTRQLAHHIADRVFEQLTGVKGAFATRIAYVKVEGTDEPVAYHLQIADADGHNAKTLFSSRQPIMSPAWSPDGRQLAFVSFQKGESQIDILDVAKGGKIREVAHFPGINGAPAFSPDGTKLAIVLSKQNVAKLYLLDLLTLRMQALTSGWSIDTEPSFSPDGKRIAFTSNRAGKPQVYELTLKTGHIKRLTFEGEYNAKPVYTPDGKGLVVIYRHEKAFHIAHLDLTNQYLQILTQGGLEESPTIAPNGKMILYATREGSRGILGEVSIDGRVQIKLPLQEGNVQAPAWSPFFS